MREAVAGERGGGPAPGTRDSPGQRGAVRGREGQAQPPPRLLLGNKDKGVYRLGAGPTGAWVRLEGGTCC